MTPIGVSRRKALEAGICALAGAVALPVKASVGAGTGLSPANEQLVRKWYKTWQEEKNDWAPFDRLLADNFTFTSANNDDHISKSLFKTRCWQSQINFLDHFDLEQVIGSGSSVFVKYLCHTKNGKSFRNVEYLQLKGGKLESIECYFGAKDSFPSAISKSA